MTVYRCPNDATIPEATHRKGRPFAAYLHPSHATGEKTARTVATPDRLLVVDCNSAGQPPV